MKQPKRMDHVNAGWRKMLVEHPRRSEGLKDEKVAELFMVKLVKTEKGRPKKEKKILKELGLTVVKFLLKLSC